MQIAARRHPNVATVASANKTVRIACAMTTRATDCQPELTEAQQTLRDTPYDGQQVEAALTAPAKVRRPQLRTLQGASGIPTWLFYWLPDQSGPLFLPRPRQ